MAATCSRREDGWVYQTGGTAVWCCNAVSAAIISPTHQHQPTHLLALLLEFLQRLLLPHTGCPLHLCIICGWQALLQALPCLLQHLLQLSLGGMQLQCSRLVVVVVKTS